MKRKRIIITLSVVAAVLVILFGGIVIRNRLNDYSHILRLNWNLILPSDSGCSEIYSDDSGPSFHGDGINVPDDRRPEYKDCSFWYQQKYGGDEMIILQDKNQKNLYVAESFI